MLHLCGDRRPPFFGCLLRVSSTRPSIAATVQAGRAATAKNDESHALARAQLSVASSGMTCLLQLDRSIHSSRRRKKGNGGTKIFPGHSP